MVFDASWRIGVAGLLAAVALLVAAPTIVQAQQQVEACMNARSAFSPEARIAGCTAVIRSARRSGENVSWAYYNRGLAYFAKDQYERVIVDFTEAIRLSPGDAYAWNGRCWVRAIVGRDLKLALADCNESLRLRANEPATLDSRGLTCLKLGQFNHAIADYDAALKLNPLQVESYFGRGVAKLRKGDKDGGNSDIAMAKSLQPDIAEEFLKYGIRLDDLGSGAAASADADCAPPVAINGAPGRVAVH